MAPNNKIKLSIFYFSAILFMAFTFVVMPIFNNIKSNSGVLAQKEADLIALETKISNLEDFRLLYKDLEGTLNKIDDLFIDSKVPVSFINFLETTASEKSLLIEIFSAANQKIKGDPWPSVIFQVKLNGYFSDFLKFWKKIESGIYLAEIKSLSINSSEEGKTGISLTIKVFSK